MDLTVTTRALIGLGALAALLAAERLAPAAPAGRGSLRHDARNLLIGLANASLGLALALWILPPLPESQGGAIGRLGLVGAGAVIAAFLLLDLWMYAWHRLAHGLPVLWRIHRVHHSDGALNATSAVRFHPLEPLLTLGLRLPLAWLLGIPGGSVLLYELVFFPVVVFQHSNVRLPARVDRALRLVIVTPALHRIHHSPERVETDSNFGSVLSLWDRLARSLRTRPRLEPQPFGLLGFAGERWQTLAGLLATPFRRAPGRRHPAA
jgi:sterol desaturase/sphingolipid hydroxylase (fatty acid hydroxylase superfamily)